MKEEKVEYIQKVNVLMKIVDELMKKRMNEWQK